MRYFIVDTEETKGIHEVSEDMLKVFGKQGLIPNDAVEVSYWKFLWFRVKHGI